MGTAHRTRTREPPEFAPRLPWGRTGIGSRLPASTAQRSGELAGWQIILADRCEARLYESDARISTLTLRSVTRNSEARQHERDLVSARAGNKFNRPAGTFQALAAHGGARRGNNERFAKAVAAVALQAIDAGGRLAVIAGSRTLAEILGALPIRARARVAVTVPRELTHAGAAELRTRLRTALLPSA